MTSEQAVAQAPAPLAAAFRPGLQALGATSGVLVCREPQRLAGSIDLDTALAASRPRAPRWDYGVGVRVGSAECAISVEVHTATTTEVDRVLAKLAWLKTWLRCDASALDRLTGESSQAFFWAATRAGVHIAPASPQARRLRQAGLDLPRRAVRVC